MSGGGRVGLEIPNSGKKSSEERVMSRGMNRSRVCGSRGRVIVW